jgi:GDP-mannose 6-dehydrogenase
MKRVSVFGMGYVGCVSAVSLARVGHEVVGVDVNPDKVALINSGKSPIVEPGLETILANVVKQKRLRATSSCIEAVENTDLALICVGTPSGPNGQLDFSALLRVAEEIGRALRNRAEPYTVVVRSTVLPGTIEGVFSHALNWGLGKDRRAKVRIAVNPEFMREGTALQDFAAPPMNLVGCDRADTAEMLQSLYMGVDAPFVHTSIKTAEMLKYACNAFHALKVCFANEIGDVCTALGVDAQELMRIFCMDRKLNIAPAYLRPGFAFGGSCLPKDLRALTYAATHADVSLPLLSSILPSNEAQIRHTVDTVLATRKKRIGVVGLAFKAGTDDLRESPMVSLVEALIGKGCQVRILDRYVSIARLVGANRSYIEQEIPHIASLMCDSADELLKHAEVIVVGKTGKDVSELLHGINPDQKVVDLTRGALRIQSLEETVAI